MKMSALLEGVGEVSPSQDVEIENVTDKLSEVKENTLFICIDGDTVDGNVFVKEALKKGAVAVVSEKDTECPVTVRVPAARSALSHIAANFYGNPAKHLDLLGITGTNGKTTTAHLVRHILKFNGKKCGLTGTVKQFTGEGEESSNLTTPEPFELQRAFAKMVENGCEYCVSEVSSQALSQCRTDGIHFKASAITNITPEHLDYHLNMENYISSKLRLFEQSDSAVINIDDKNIKENRKRLPSEPITVSVKDKNADYFAKNIVSNANGIEFELVTNGASSCVCVPLTGVYNVYNVLTAIALCEKAGVSVNEAVKALPSFCGVEGRSEKVPVNRDFSVIIDFAHTPDGFQNIIPAVREVTGGRVITVFGCGGDRDKSKRAEMGSIAAGLSDIVIVTDDNPRTENPIKIICDILGGMSKSPCRTVVVADRKEAIHLALKIADKGDTVLLLGKGHEKYQITSEGKIPFDERKIIDEFLKQDEKLWSLH